MIDPGLTEYGTELLKRSGEAYDLEDFKHADHFRLMTVWLQDDGGYFYYERVIITLSDVTEFINSVFEYESSLPDTLSVYWITVASLTVVENHLPWPAIVSPWEWTGVRPIWVRPHFTIPPPGELQERLKHSIARYADKRQLGTV